uniref:Uncharacterized protein n=1 Tax=Amphimedon queenslandica TaxID=400682 RepID=A0A1X7UBJ0_AMPQE
MVTRKLEGAQALNLTITKSYNRLVVKLTNVFRDWDNFSNSWELESVMLACKHVIGRHMGENIAT